MFNTFVSDHSTCLFVAKYTHCIQHNFILLQMELPETDHATAIMENVLDESNISDIEHCIGNIRQKSKLLKILLMKGNPACMELFRAIEVDLKRNDLITTMEIKSAEKVNRGKLLLLR